MTAIRFSLRQMLLAVAAVALAFAYIGTGSTKLGCGSTTVRLTFRILDDRSGKPIAGASLQYGAYSDAMHGLTTGLDGKASATLNPGCTSYVGPFFRRYRVLSYLEWLRIEAKGYLPSEEPLRAYTGRREYHDRFAPPPIEIRLKRAEMAGQPG